MAKRGWSATALGLALMACAPIASSNAARVTHPRSGTASTLSCGGDENRRGILSVSVVDEFGAPVPEAVVTVVDPRGSAVLASGNAGSHDTLEIPNMGGKSGYVVASQLGFHTGGAEVHVPSQCEGSVVVTLKVAGTICDVEVDAQPANTAPSKTPP